MDKFWKENDCFYVKWPEMSSNGWAQVSTNARQRNTVVKFPDKDPESEMKNAIIMEVNLKLKNFLTYT